MSTANTALPIAVQLYTLRNLPQSLDDVLAMVAAIGYTGVETIGTHSLDVAAMQALLDKHQLQAVSTHVGLQALEEELESLVAFNQALGNNTLTIPALPQEMRTDHAEGWRQIGRRLDVLGGRCRDAGMQLLYHNHAWEMVDLDGKLALDWMMESADPQNLQLELDLAWVVRGGEDAVELLNRYQGRCPRIHAKDLAPEGQNQDEMGFADVGYGILDWTTLLPTAQTIGSECFIVEHDLPKDPLGSIRRSYEFLREQLS